MISPSDPRAIVFIGPMGAGKTSVGRRVARRLGLEFTDTDKVVVREHGPIPAIFAEHGEGRFRAAESKAVTDALARGGVVSVGGGAVMDATTREALAGHRVILLTVAPHTVASRLRGTDRPLVAGDDPMVRWQQIYAERRPVYDEVADATFDTSTGPISGVVTAILEWLREDS